jgi:hypothetical protein
MHKAKAGRHKLKGTGTMINYSSIARRVGASPSMIYYVMTGKRKSARLSALIAKLLKEHSKSLAK